jgi:SnoaL-like protein
MSDTRLDVVKRMWIEYREQGVDPALRLLHPEVEFLAEDGEMWSGHDGVRKFFSQFESRGEEFAAAPYTFEPHGEGVIVAGHRRITSPQGADAGYLYFSHCVEDGLITRIAAWNTRAEAERDVAPDGGCP